MSDDASKYDDPMFNEGVTHTVELLAKELGVTDWVAGDGCEDYDEDLQQTLLNIIEAKGLYSSEDGSWATLASPRMPGREEIARLLARVDWPLAPAPEQAAWIERHWPTKLNIADAILALSLSPAREEQGWHDIGTAPKDGRTIEVKGNAGPYGVTEWRGLAKWYRPTNWHRDRSTWASPIGAVLILAGYTPTHWRPTPPSSDGGEK